MGKDWRSITCFISASNWFNCHVFFSQPMRSEIYTLVHISCIYTRFSQQWWLYKSIISMLSMLIENLLQIISDVQVIQERIDNCLLYSLQGVIWIWANQNSFYETHPSFDPCIRIISAYFQSNFWTSVRLVWFLVYSQLNLATIGCFRDSNGHHSDHRECRAQDCHKCNHYEKIEHVKEIFHKIWIFLRSSVTYC